MDWYLGHRQVLEAEVQKFSDPPSEALLPPLPPQARCAAALPAWKAYLLSEGLTELCSLCSCCRGLTTPARVAYLLSLEQRWASQS